MKQSREQLSQPASSLPPYELNAGEMRSRVETIESSRLQVTQCVIRWTVACVGDS